LAAVFAQNKRQQDIHQLSWQLHQILMQRLETNNGKFRTR
jgi:hypothetical protein